jgi:hypothetical protein
MAPRRRVRVSPVPSAESAAAADAVVAAAGAAVKAARTAATDSCQAPIRMDAARTRWRRAPTHRVTMGRVTMGRIAMGRVATVARTRPRHRKARAPASRLRRRAPHRRAPRLTARHPHRYRRHRRPRLLRHPKRRAPQLRKNTWCGPGRGTPLLAAARTTVKDWPAARPVYRRARRAGLSPRGADGP